MYADRELVMELVMCLFVQSRCLLTGEEQASACAYEHHSRTAAYSAVWCRLGIVSYLCHFSVNI